MQRTSEAPVRPVRPGATSWGRSRVGRLNRLGRLDWHGRPDPVGAVHADHALDPLGVVGDAGDVGAAGNLSSGRLVGSAATGCTDIPGGPRRPFGHAGRGVRFGFYSLEAALVALTVWGQAGEPRTLLALDIVAGAASMVLLPALERRLIPVGCLLAVLSVVSPAVTPVAAVSVMQAAQRRKLSVAARLGAVAVVGQLGRGVWRPVDGLDFTWWVVEVCAVATALVGWGAYTRSRGALIVSLCERAERAEAEQGRRVAEARVAERGRIAREMHDVLAHRLTLLATYAGALEYRPEIAPEKISEAAGVIRSNVRDALVELRQIIYMLRDDDEEARCDSDLGLGRPQPSLRDLPELADQSRGVGAEVHLDLRVTEPFDCPAVTGRTAYRVVQEALTNARRHAPGVPVLVIVGGRPGGLLTIDVHNALLPEDARPEAAELGTGTGLIGLTERVSLAGGRVEYGPADGEFRLHVQLPWSV